MALDLSLANELRLALRAFGAAHGAVAVPGGAGKALEAWLLIRLAAEASQARHWSVTLRLGDGRRLRPGTPFLFRSQPGGIGPRNAIGPGFVRLDRRGGREREVLELHGSLQWLGRSGAYHEWDVSLLPGEVGQALRAQGGGRPSGLPIAGYECKDKVRPGSIDEVRQTLARLFDLAFVTQTNAGGGARIFVPLGQTRWGRRSSQYKSYFALGAFGIVRVGAFQAGARDLADHFSIDRYWAIYTPASRSVVLLLARFREILDRLDELV